MPAAIDLTGRTYSRLVVISKDSTDPTKRKWICQCSCGNTKSIDRNSFIKGLTTSCGCRHKEIVTTHGGYQSRLHTIWADMKARCKPDRKGYGARGIVVCLEWTYSFLAFQTWAINNGYADNLSIDRIDDAKVYSPATCRWSTDAVQSRNRRSKEGSSSRHVGVHYLKENKNYRAVLNENGKSTHIGVFATEDEAAMARDAYIRLHNLEGYVINFK